MNIRSAWAKLKRALFENASLRQTLIKNTFWLTISNVTGRVIRAGLLIFVARTLGAAGYGVFSYAVGVASLFSIFSDIGVSSILIREGSRNPKGLPDYLGTAFVIKIALIAASMIILFVAAPHINTNVPEALPLLPIAAFLIFFDGMRDFSVSVSRAQEKMQQEAWIVTATNLAITGIGIVLLMLHPTPRALMAGYTLGSAVGTVLAYWLLRHHFFEAWGRFHRKLVMPILIDAVPFGLMGLLGSLMLQTDTVMLGYYTNAAAVGLYAAAQRPIQVLYIIPGILSSVLFPAMSRFAAANETRFRFVLERGLTLSMMITIPLFVGGLALGQSLILYLFGSDYTGAAISFLILLGTILINFPAAIIGNALFAKDKQKIFIVIMAVGASANAYLNYLFIPKWGIVGSSISTIIAQILMNGITWWKLKTVVSFRTLRYLWKIILASGVMGVATFFLNRLGVNVLISILLMAGLYFGLLYLLKEETLRYFRPKDFLGAPPEAAPETA